MARGRVSWVPLADIIDIPHLNENWNVARQGNLRLQGTGAEEKDLRLLGDFVYKEQRCMWWPRRCGGSYWAVNIIPRLSDLIWKSNHFAGIFFEIEELVYRRGIRLRWITEIIGSKTLPDPV